MCHTPNKHPPWTINSSTPTPLEPASIYWITPSAFAVFMKTRFTYKQNTYTMSVPGGVGSKLNKTTALFSEMTEHCENVFFSLCIFQLTCQTITNIINLLLYLHSCRHPQHPHHAFLLKVEFVWILLVAVPYWQQNKLSQTSSLFFQNHAHWMCQSAGYYSTNL